MRSFTTKVHKVDRVTALCRRGARRLPWTRSAVSAQPCWPRPIAAAVGFSEACTHPLQHPHRDVTQCHTRDMTRRGCYTRWGRVHTGPPHGSTHRREEGTGPLSLARWRWSRTEQKTSAHAHAGPSPMQKTPALRVGKLFTMSYIRTYGESHARPSDKLRGQSSLRSSAKQWQVARTNASLVTPVCLAARDCGAALTE